MVRPEWPTGDQQWVARYRSSMAGKNVPAVAVHERERELLDAARAAGRPAAELFGDAANLATDDVTELATANEAVRTSEGSGVRSTLREAGGTLAALACVATVLMSMRSGWSIDVDVAPLLLAASVVTVAVGWVLGRAFFSAGRPMAMVRVLLAVAAVAVGGVAAAVLVGPGQTAASGVSVPLLGLGLLAPGVVALVVASRMSEATLQEDWDDAEWLRRFRAGLRSRLVPAETTRDHVAEIHQAMGSGASSAYAEFGHPLALARELAEVNRTARARRWWGVTVLGTGTPLLTAAVVVGLGSWQALTIPVTIFLVLSAVITLVAGWGDRPWARSR